MNSVSTHMFFRSTYYCIAVFFCDSSNSIVRNRLSILPRVDPKYSITFNRFSHFTKFRLCLNAFVVVST